MNSMKQGFQDIVPGFIWLIWMWIRPVNRLFADCNTERPGLRIESGQRAMGFQ